MWYKRGEKCGPAFKNKVYMTAGLHIDPDRNLQNECLLYMFDIYFGTSTILKINLFNYFWSLYEKPSSSLQ